MTSRGGLALLLSLVLGFGLVLTGPALADNPPEDHPFCAQGGNGVTGGAGGTEQTPGVSEDEFDGEEPSTVLIPRHLAEDFGSTEDEDEDGDGFIEVAAPSEGEGPVGQAAGAFEGGHGGGPGGGQGGSTFFGAGDGGCSPQFQEVERPPAPPGRRLPITGALTDQVATMGGLLLSLGLLSFCVISVLRKRPADGSEVDRTGDTPFEAAPAEVIHGG